MTDSELEGTAWPHLNPDYRGIAVEDLPLQDHFGSRYYKDLTPEFLLEECLNRGWSKIHGRVQSYEEVSEEGGWYITCRLGTDTDYCKHFVPFTREDFPDLT